jgi:peptidoglycan/xylan/chitin deacetylase (PgdA/CDA1 family)
MMAVFLSGVAVSPALIGQEKNGKRLAFTFEYLPFMKPMGYWRPREISNQILRTLEKNKIKAAGFVIQQKVEDDPSTYVILDDWVSRHHTLGNQTWGNVDLNSIEAKHFIEHIADGHKYLRNITRAHPQNYRFLRYPNLHQGEKLKKKKRVKRAIERSRYQVAHVSVKTATNFFNRPFVNSLQDPSNSLEALKNHYLKHVLDSLDYSESQSQIIFGDNIPHILQLHAGVAISTMLEPLIGVLKDRGYTFISLQEALNDPAYQAEENYVGPMGLTFVDRVAATRGIPFEAESGIDARKIEKELEDLFP